MTFSKHPADVFSLLVRYGLAVIAAAGGVFCVVAGVAVSREPHVGGDDPGRASLVVSLLMWSVFALACVYVAWALTVRRRR